MRTRKHSRSRVGTRGGTRGQGRGKGSKRKSQKASLSRRSAIQSLRIIKKPVSRKQVTTAHTLLDRMGISGVSTRNIRTWLQSTSEMNLTPSARELVSKYDEAVRSSARTLRNAAKFETMAGKYSMLYRKSTKHKKLSAIKEALSSIPTSFENVIGKFKTVSKPFGRLNPDDASYFLLYIHTHFVTPENRPFQPLLIPKEIKEVSYDNDLLIKKYGQDEEELIQNIESKEMHQIIQYLMEQARSPSVFELPDENELNEADPNLENVVANIEKSYKNVYLAQGKINITVNKYTSPLETIVKNEYAAGEPIPFFFVFQTPKGIIAAHESHVSILVLYNGKWYSLGLGYSGFVDDQETVPRIQRVGLYNPDHVIGIEGSDSDDIPHHLRLIDYGVFKKKHFDRIMRIVEHKSATIKGAGPMVATFGREEEDDDGETQFIVGGLTSQIIPINMQYKYFTCAANKPDSLNCTSFAQYVFSERIECSVVGAMGGAGGFVVPNLCKRKKYPITAAKLQEFINVFEGNTPITAEVMGDLTWE